MSVSHFVRLEFVSLCVFVLQGYEDGSGSGRESGRAGGWVVA